MQIQVDAAKLVNSPDLITVWDSRKLTAARGNPMMLYLQQTIDQMGVGSQRAQGLAAVLTSVQRLHQNPAHRLYLMCDGRECLGILKVGVKKLFIRMMTGQLKEIEPLCVLDFYVHETQQRSGKGRQLFEFMLQQEGVAPERLGYDRPSPKFVGFLRKHYGLSEYVEQNNNFIVFNRYFTGGGASAPGGRAGLAATVKPTTANAPGGFSMFDPQPMRGNGGVGSARDLLARTAVPVPTPQQRQPADAPLGRPGPQGLSGLAALSATQTNQPNKTESLAATLVARSSCVASSAQSRRTRENSPTRSGSTYNIISLQGEGANASPPARFGRRSVRTGL